MLSRYRETVRLWTDPVGHALYRLRLRPNHLTVAGLAVSLLSATAFVAGRTRTAGTLLLLAGLFDFFDGSLARASKQVTPFGAFLDSVIDRYSDLVVLLGIVVLFSRMPHARGAIVAMAGLVGSVMVSYTKARAESIGVECNVGVMERPERMICLIAGALLGLLEPALWVLAVLANVTAIQRIVFTRNAVRNAALLPALGVVLLCASPVVAQPPEVTPAAERAWADAVVEFQRGNVEPVLREFSEPRALASPIGDYVRFLLADARHRVGDLAGARTAALEIADRYAKSPLAPPALLKAATLASRVGDEAEVVALLKRVIGSYPDAAELPGALYLIAMAGEARGQLDAAALAYRELTVLAPATGWADGASDRLAELAADGLQVPELTHAQRLDRADRLLRAGVATTAADEAEQLVQEARDAGIAVRALEVLADASARLGRWEASARALERAVARVAPSRKPRLNLDRARALVRAGQSQRALAVLDTVIAEGTEAEAATAAVHRANTLEDLGREAEARRGYRAVVARYPDQDAAGRALWQLGWLEYLAGQAADAERTWSRVDQVPGGRGYHIPALYWAARLREQRDGDAATALYRRVLDEAPRSYYGVLAARRLAARPPKPPDTGTAAEPVAPAGVSPSLRLPEDPREAIADDPAFARIGLLRRIGLTEFAVEELTTVVLGSIADPVRLYGLSSAYVEDERYHMALRILRRHFGAAAVAGDPALPQAFWEMLYPIGWREELTAAAEQSGLDPHLVAALVREESSYHPQALSPAGARGLMQLMPSTARPMAELRGLAFRDGEVLDEPGVNLELGTSFLAALVREFGDPRLAVAAYNAGPARVRQWWRARQWSDVEVFVERIPFDETRLFVKRVMHSWEEYRRIYGPP